MEGQRSESHPYPTMSTLKSWQRQNSMKNLQSNAHCDLTCGRCTVEYMQPEVISTPSPPSPPSPITSEPTGSRYHHSPWLCGGGCCPAQSMRIHVHMYIQNLHTSNCTHTHTYIYVSICVAHAWRVIPTLPATPAQLMRPGIG